MTTIRDAVTVGGQRVAFSITRKGSDSPFRWAIDDVPNARGGEVSGEEETAEIAHHRVRLVAAAFFTDIVAQLEVRCARCNVPMGDAHDPELCWHCQGALCGKCHAIDGTCGSEEIPQNLEQAKPEETLYANIHMVKEPVDPDALREVVEKKRAART